jgi:hypothetical protein
MNLPEPEGRLFYRLFVGLQRLANARHRVVPPFDTEAALLSRPMEQRLAVRDALYADPDCFNTFLDAGDLPAIPDAAEIVAGWRDHRIAGRFLVLRHLKRHTIFLSTEGEIRAYGVLGLADPLERMFPEPPALVAAVLLPFRGRIIYDGMLITMGPNIVFGGGFRRGLEADYREAKAREGVITALPRAGMSDPVASEQAALEARLRVLLRTKDTRGGAAAEIQALRSQGPGLERTYHQALGKALAPSIGHDLRACGITRGCFAVYDGMVVASAATPAELRRRVREIFPDDRADHAYVLRLRG